ncbi:fatty acyl-AMP ligase [Streptomyces canus]|uniref:fatty acyl-AMP ligase n=1 Tax=Streptomyces canus TaxID=58343 RepID=UPI0033BFF162
MTVELLEHLNVAEAFAARAAAHPERNALTIVRSSAETEQETVSYGELARRVRRRAERLAARFAPGERVLVALPTGTAFVEVYLACLTAGLVAVPAPVPGDSANATDRVAGIAEDCAPALVIAEVGAWAPLAERLRGHGPVVEAAGEAGPGDGPVPYRGDRDTLAVLQYSSGSTGSPRGVMLSHGNVLANTTAFCAATGVGPEDSFGIWLPLHHDMGLFGQLTTALLLGAPIVLMAPTVFVRRPVEWLRMIDRHGITVTAGPDFAYDLCLRLVTDDMLDGVDLSRLRVAFNGAEPIQVPTMTAFTRRFARAGLRPDVMSPAYGLAEATVYATAVPVGRAPTVLVADPARLAAAEHPRLCLAENYAGREITSVGRPENPEIRIVDPATRHALPAGSVGEIWVRGPNVGSGYWGRPELDAQVFAARLEGTGVDERATESWLRTGDLGALVDGELFVTGRLKEMLVVRGRNLFPHDLEQEARAAHQALRGHVGAAFAVAAPDERIVLVHEVAPRTADDELPRAAAAVSRRLTTACGVPVHNVLLVRRGTVRRTTSGKIRRSEMRDRFLAGDITALHTELDREVRQLRAGGTQ